MKGMHEYYTLKINNFQFGPKEVRKIVRKLIKQRQYHIRYLSSDFQKRGIK